MISAEVSLYPQKTSRASEIIRDSLDAVADLDLDTKVGSISTQLTGTEEEIWSGLKILFDRAQKESEVSMVVTLSNSGS
ncbi:YkoF family thiamine/hydroxymethylpyrimidine-binding protein [Candidatus Formimonas warabiya]|uniref:Thiamin/hydroxymethyl pyrimidine-binding YkoF putative domain-containing protein n=1 Tax=Formimonas warabiya TaxID=1761012 RepID=A0A3G1KN80_FORW1|nr:YkoF family thiamine/hydroxymethylpyrimidine-binding protein [Candidatus Formimonas warabiya]ATW23919.1 hypothetical protein DCMF_03105 [Candidatus Formimonas warabiya]